MFSPTSTLSRRFRAVVPSMIFLAAWESKHVNPRYHNTCVAVAATSKRRDGDVPPGVSAFHIRVAPETRPETCLYRRVLSEKSVIFKAEPRLDICRECLPAALNLSRAASEHREEFTNARYRRKIDQSTTAVHQRSDLGKFPFPRMNLKERAGHDRTSKGLRQ